MGIGLDNYTVRESMRQVENYLSNDVLNTIENISMQKLIASGTDPVVHNVISELDLSVIGEKEILKAADADSMQRVQETEQNDFSYEFYRRIERNKRSIFVLGQTEEGVQKVKAELQEAFPKLILAGEYALENCVGNLDAVINEMNATTPDVRRNRKIFERAAARTGEARAAPGADKSALSAYGCRGSAGSIR